MNDDYSAIHSVLLSIGQSIAGSRTFHDISPTSAVGAQRGHVLG